MHDPRSDQHKAGIPNAVPQTGFAPYGYPSASSPQEPYMPNPVTDTDPFVKGFEFSSESIRRGFIRKVYSILSVRKKANNDSVSNLEVMKWFLSLLQVQLSFTLLVVMMFAHHDATQDFARENMWLFFVSLILVLVTIISLSCCEGVRRTFPTNIIFLTLFTGGESLMVGYCTLNYDPDLVITTEPDLIRNILT